MESCSCYELIDSNNRLLQQLWVYRKKRHRNNERKSSSNDCRWQSREHQPYTLPWFSIVFASLHQTKNKANITSVGDWCEITESQHEEDMQINTWKYEEVNKKTIQKKKTQYNIEVIAVGGEHFSFSFFSLIKLKHFQLTLRMSVLRIAVGLNVLFQLLRINWSHFDKLTTV